MLCIFEARLRKIRHKSISRWEDFVVGAVFVELGTTRHFLRILSVSGGHKGGWPEWKQSTE